MLSCIGFEFPTFTNYKISITLLYFTKMSWNGRCHSVAKVGKIFENGSRMFKELDKFRIGVCED